MTVYKIKHLPTGKYYKSGLRRTCATGKTWSKIGHAKNAIRCNMHSIILADIEIEEFFIAETKVASYTPVKIIGNNERFTLGYVYARL